jgi:hypothetical protein
VARTYAGILGPLALFTSLVRGAVHAWSTEKTLLVAWTSLLVFAVLGWVVGWVAERVVDEEIRARMAVAPGNSRPKSEQPGAA